MAHRQFRHSPRAQRWANVPLSFDKACDLFGDPPLPCRIGPYGWPLMRHKDGNIANWAVDNLEWAPSPEPSELEHHAPGDGFLTEDDVRTIRRRWNGA